MTPLRPREHWKGLYGDLWTTLANPRSIGHAQNLTGADIQICCREGKLAFHQNLLRKFTNLLDFTRYIYIEKHNFVCWLYGLFFRIFPSVEKKIFAKT